MNNFRMILTLLALPVIARADVPLQSIHEDARAIRRIAQVSNRDLPRGVLKRIIEEDIDLLRGKRSDATYEYASYERDEDGRVSRGSTIREGKKKGDLAKSEVRGEIVYRLLVEVPTRRLVVAKNRRVFIDRVELEFTPMGGSPRKQTIPAGVWLEPGESKGFDLPEISRKAHAVVFSRVDRADGGTASIEVSLLKAKLADNPDSPYLTFVHTAKKVRTAIEGETAPQIKITAEKFASELEARMPASRVKPKPIVSSRVEAAPEPPFGTLEAEPEMEKWLELQTIEDLLTGNEAERREGLDRLHQLVRKLRPTRMK